MKKLKVLIKEEIDSLFEDDLDDEIQIDEISYSRLFAKTPTRYRERARDIRVRLKTVKNGRFYYQTTTNSNGNVHNQWVKPLPKKIVLSNINENVITWCDCNDFKFENEWLLWKNNTSHIINSNGKPLTIKNPERLPKLCKHLVAIMNDLKSQIRKYISKRNSEKSKMNNMSNNNNEIK